MQPVKPTVAVEPVQPREPVVAVEHVQPVQSTQSAQSVLVNDADNITLARLENIKHIHTVREYLYRMIEQLDERARNHDASKLESPEAEIYGQHWHELQNTKYDTPEYAALLEKVKPALDNHYAKNRHHPQHWPNGIDDMTLIDLLEMLCDWKASTHRNKNGNIRTSIAANKKRYKMSPQLMKIFNNTVRELFQD